MALGLNGFYQDGGFVCAHRVASQLESRSAAVLALASGEAEQFVAEARRVASRDETTAADFVTPLARSEEKIARTESEFDHWEAASDRQQAQFVRLEARQERIRAIKARLTCRRIQTVEAEPAVFKFVRIQACPRVHVNIPRMPAVNVPRIDIPSVSIPSVTIPTIRVPQVDIQRVEIPKIDIPNISVPAIAVPAVPAIHIEISDADPV